MSLEETINTDLKAAMMAKDEARLRGVRAIKSAIINAKTEKGANGVVTPEKEVQMLQKLVKQRKESADIYKTQNREDLYEIEMAEMRVIEPYLPQQMTRFEIEGAVQDIITRLGATSTQDMGRVMGVASKEMAGQADGKTISEVVRQLLG